MGKSQRNRVTRQKSSQSVTSLGERSINGDNVPPTNMSNTGEIRAFLHRCEQYQAKISDFDTVSRCLYELLEEDNVLRWSPSCNVAYEYLSSAVGKLTLSPTAAPLLHSGGDSDQIIGSGVQNSMHDPPTPMFHPRPNTNIMSEGTANRVVDAIDSLTQRLGQMEARSLPRLRKYDESSSEEESDNATEVLSTPRLIRRSKSNGRNIKLPPYTGKESWKVWFNRFDEVADRKGWDVEDRLDELLPKLQGSAGEFVYGQLSKKVRGSYKALVKELNTRFRVIENPKTFGVKFSRRDQKLGEAVEDYAAALKEIYDKAHPGRDERTREEDLLRRFLDGLTDEKAKVQVEFVKAPSCIDEAVSEVVNFVETKSRIYGEKNKKMARMVRPNESDESSDEENSSESISPQNVNRVHIKNTKESTTQGQIDCLVQKVDEIAQKLDGANRSYQANKRKPFEFRGNCYNCGQKGHTKRFCREPVHKNNGSNGPQYQYAPPTMPQYIPQVNGPVDSDPRVDGPASLSVNAPSFQPLN